MKIWIDTNIILDVLTNRKGFVEASEKIFKLCEVHKVIGYVSALSISDMIYIMRKESDKATTASMIEKLSLIFNVIELKAEDLLTAAKMDFEDFEDAIQSIGAERVKADYIITRNIKDFKNSSVPVVGPSEFLDLI